MITGGTNPGTGELEIRLAEIENRVQFYRRSIARLLSGGESIRGESITRAMESLRAELAERSLLLEIADEMRSMQDGGAR